MLAGDTADNKIVLPLGPLFHLPHPLATDADVVGQSHLDDGGGRAFVMGCCGTSIIRWRFGTTRRWPMLTVVDIYDWVIVSDNMGGGSSSLKRGTTDLIRMTWPTPTWGRGRYIAIRLDVAWERHFGSRYR